MTDREGREALIFGLTNERPRSLTEFVDREATGGGMAGLHVGE